MIEWLTSFDESALSTHLAAGTTFEKLVDELAKGKAMDKILRA